MIMRKTRTAAVLAVIFTVLLTSACAQSNAGKTLPGYRTAETEEKETEKESPKIMYLIEAIDTTKESITLKGLTSGTTFNYPFSLSTKFRDSHGKIAGWNEFSPGRVVTIEEDIRGHLKNISLSDKVWEQDRIKRYSIDIDRNMMTIGNTKYRLKDTETFSNDSISDISSIGTGDELKAVGRGKDIISIVVTTGHGNIQLINTDLFKGTLVQIGSSIFTEISGDPMTIEAPEGAYDLTAASNGYGGTIKINVTRGQTTVVNLNDLKGEGPKNCKVSFEIAVPGAEVSIDGTTVDISSPIELKYGSHRLRVSADGYDTWSGTLVVNSPEAKIALDLTDESKTGSDEEENKDSSGASNESSSGTEKSRKENSKDTSEGKEDSKKENRNSDDSSGSKDTSDYLTTLSNIASTLMGSGS